MADCGTTHYQGCECHEAGWKRQVDLARMDETAARMEMHRYRDMWLKADAEIVRLRNALIKACAYLRDEGLDAQADSLESD